MSIDVDRLSDALEAYVRSAKSDPSPWARDVDDIAADIAAEYARLVPAEDGGVFWNETAHIVPAEDEGRCICTPDQYQGSGHGVNCPEYRHAMSIDKLRQDALDDPVTVCDHRDERGSTIMQARDDRYECIVCGTRFRLVPAEDEGRLLTREQVRTAYRHAAGETHNSTDLLDKMTDYLNAALAATPEPGDDMPSRHGDRFHKQ